MKPFQAECGEIKRIAYTSRRVGRRGKVTLSEVAAKLCEEKIWFEASLRHDVAVGKCSIASHNPVYRVIGSPSSKSIGEAR